MYKINSTYVNVEPNLCGGVRKFKHRWIIVDVTDNDSKIGSVGQIANISNLKKFTTYHLICQSLKIFATRLSNWQHSEVAEVSRVLCKIEVLKAVMIHIVVFGL
jgi:hypothetical protein